LGVLNVNEVRSFILLLKNFSLSTDDQTVFGATLQRFVECTLLSREQDPYVVVRRVRQFLNGFIFYLNIFNYIFC
jgi:hypothetical protein